ncbi:type II toxin-antitoxin system VapC family toxin [Candidatus Gottesmanbacteria bacterium]|nr:type II toxin-antitoxin system VapC family toxin [Candidatus Gottesmanbacteria bacterium]
MTKFVIDTSVVLKWISGKKESDIKESLELYQLLKEGEVAIFAPSFLLVELLNILYWKRIFTHEEIISFIARVSESGINFVDLLKNDTEEILHVVLKYGVTAYDAIFLYVARTSDCKLVSADRKLHSLLDQVISPSQALEILAKPLL